MMPGCVARNLKKNVPPPPPTMPGLTGVGTYSGCATICTDLPASCHGLPAVAGGGVARHSDQHPLPDGHLGTLAVVGLGDLIQALSPSRLFLSARPRPFHPPKASLISVFFRKRNASRRH